MHKAKLPLIEVLNLILNQNSKWTLNKILDSWSPINAKLINYNLCHSNSKIKIPRTPPVAGVIKVDSKSRWTLVWEEIFLWERGISAMAFAPISVTHLAMCISFTSWVSVSSVSVSASSALAPPVPTEVSPAPSPETCRTCLDNNDTDFI